MCQIIIPISTNELVAEASISYSEHVLQTLMFSRHVIHEERHLGKVFSGFIHKNKRVQIIWGGPLATPQNSKNRRN